MPKKNHGPHIKDDDRYEALRRNGASKEKAARIANSDASATGRRGGKSRSYEQWKKDELMAKAKDVGIPGRSRMSKGELIDALRDH